MHRLLLAAAVFGVATSTWMTVTPALARDYPFCIKGDGYESSVGDCSFDTYQQCAAAASGRGDSCDANPYFAVPAKPSAVRPRRPARPH
jgi:hypothetical protein